MKILFKRIIFGALIFTMLAAIAEGGVVVPTDPGLVHNDILGTDPGLENPYTNGQEIAANLTFSGIGHGTNVTGRTTDNRYNGVGWDTTTLDENAYFGFTLTPNSGFKIDFVDFCYTGQTSSTGPSAFAFRSSIDGFGSNITAYSIASNTIETKTIVLSGPQFQGLTSATEFRLYGWDASGSSGTFSVNDFIFNGSVSAVPEPASALLFGMACCTLIRRRRRLVA